MTRIVKPSARYGVNKLLDQIKAAHGLRFDAGLVRLTGLTAVTISKLRSGGRLTPALALRLHESAGVSLREIYDTASLTGEDRP